MTAHPLRRRALTDLRPDNVLYAFATEGRRRQAARPHGPHVQIFEHYIEAVNACKLEL